MVRVLNHGKGAVGLGRGRSVKLRPGINDVDAAIWTAAESSPMVKALLGLGKNGGLTVGGAAETPTPQPQPPTPILDEVTEPEIADEVDDETDPVTVPDLGEMNAADAKETVAECDDLEVLVEWLRIEGRKTVVAAIDKRLATLQNDDA